MEKTNVTCSFGNDDYGLQTGNVKISDLHDFKGHPFKVEQFGKYNPKRTIFNHDIRANAKGYEYYCYMLLRHQNQRK